MNAQRIPLDQHLTCSGCGYELRGLDDEGVCPECGFEISESMALGGLRVPSRAMRWLLLCVCLYVVWGPLPGSPGAARSGMTGYKTVAIFGVLRYAALVHITSGGWAGGPPPKPDYWDMQWHLPMLIPTIAATILVLTYFEVRIGAGWQQAPLCAWLHQRKTLVTVGLCVIALICFFIALMTH